MAKGYVTRNRRREHRVVAEEMLGRSLLPGEVVHHINGIKNDNRPENLQVFSSQRDHVYAHFHVVTDDELRELLLQGFSQEELKAKGISRRQAQRVRKAMGLKCSRLLWSRARNYRSPLRTPETIVQQALELRAEGLTYRAIGERLGISHTTARSITQ